MIEREMYLEGLEKGKAIGFNEVIKQYNRMCKCFDNELSYGEDLQFCPLYHENKGCGGRGYNSCERYLLEHPQEAEKIITKWAKEFPESSNE